MRGALASLATVLAAIGIAAPASAVVPGAEGLIAFDTDRDGNTEVYRMNADATAQTRLTNNPASDQNPAWSPDGNRIAFASTRDGNSEIYVMSLDGSGQTRLTNNAAIDANATWSPDGSKIAFQTNRDGNNEIYSMNADGSGQTRLTNNAASDFRPSWSPDGTKIAFGSARDGNQEIYSMNADGSGQTRLTNNPALDAHPSWLSGGAQIVFVRAGDILRINADGTGEAKLTTTTNNSDPGGSPQGRVAFRSSRDGNSEIYTMGSDGSNQTRLTNLAANDASPDWQAQNRAPACQSITQATGPNTAIALQISCTDADGNPLTYLKGNPGNGTVSAVAVVSGANGISPFLRPPGSLSFTYTPNTNFLGNDAIAFTATDNRGGVSPVAFLTIQVAQVIPTVRSFSFTPRTPRVGRGGTFVYDLSAAGRVRIEVERQLTGRRVRGVCRTSARRGRRCTAFQFRGNLNKNAAAGTNRTAFTGRFGRRALPVGSYLATITPFDPTGEPGIPRTTTFRVRR
jgi:TolB protein